MNNVLLLRTISSLKFIMLVGILLVGSDTMAQDKITKKGGETLEVKILEVSPNEIKYHLFAEPEGPIFIMDKDRILEVTYQNGRIEKYESILTDAEFYIGQKKKALKINFLSPLAGYTQIAYEQSIRPGRSYEISLGIIGLGKNQEVANWNNESKYENQKGAFATFGYKFIRIPDFTTNNQKYGHIMQGLYARPEVMVGYFSRNTYNYSTDKIDTQKTTFGAFTVNVGKQWVFSEIFVLDIYGGLGYAFRDYKKTDNYDYNNGRLYGLISGNDDAAIAVSGGFRIGILLK